MHPKTIVIIGGGFCGTVLAANLFRQAQQPIEVILVNKGYPTGKGVAYSAWSGEFLLNVYASRMSAFADKPTHFVEWLLQTTAYGSFSAEEVATSFVPRQLYGQYLESILQETLDQNSNAFKVVAERAVGITRVEKAVTEKYQVQLASGEELVADQVVLALGNFQPPSLRNSRPEDTPELAPPLYFKDPWQPESVRQLQDHETVVMLGTGLTTVDSVLGLLEQGFKGKMIAVSTHGYLPQPYHSAHPDPEIGAALEQAETLQQMVQIFNKARKAHKETDWEDLVNGIRPHTHVLWRKLSTLEQQRFMSRLSSLWSVVRHRLPPQVHAKIQELRQTGRLQIIAGRAKALTAEDGKVAVLLQSKQASTPVTLWADRVINCTGPQIDYTAVPDPLVQSLLRQGLAAPHPLHMGLRADMSGNVLGPAGKPSAGLFTLGSSKRGELWESNAVPELREQAYQLAMSLLPVFSA